MRLCFLVNGDLLVGQFRALAPAFLYDFFERILLPIRLLQSGESQGSPGGTGGLPEVRTMRKECDNSGPLRGIFSYLPVMGGARL